MMNVTTVRFHMGNEKDIAVGHNRRNPEIVKYEKHIDPNGKYLIWRDGDIQGVYEEIFGDAIKEYNAAQTRKDRLIDGVHGYIENVRNDTRGRKNKNTQRKGKSAAYEVVVGDKTFNFDTALSNQVVFDSTYSGMVMMDKSWFSNCLVRKVEEGHSGFRLDTPDTEGVKVD